jgi:hypothetical protein
MDPHRRVRGTRAPRDEDDPRTARELPVCVGHVRGAALLPAHDETDPRITEGVERGEKALARNAEDRVDAVDAELVDEDPASRPHVSSPA